jgi:hypothetical protein
VRSQTPGSHAQLASCQVRRLSHSYRRDRFHAHRNVSRYSNSDAGPIWRGGDAQGLSVETSAIRERDAEHPVNSSAHPFFVRVYMRAYEYSGAPKVQLAAYSLEARRLFAHELVSHLWKSVPLTALADQHLGRLYRFVPVAGRQSSADRDASTARGPDRIARSQRI